MVAPIDSSKLDVILGADALRPPLTGIGRYAYELASRLRHHHDVSRVRYFSLGRWIDDPLDGLDEKSPGNPPAGSIAVRERATLRTRLAKSPAMVRMYGRVMPKLFGWRLRGNEKAIYHSPNYIVPPFSGRTLSTVLDLSHILCPQFHPPARVEYLNLTLGPSLARTDHVIAISQTVRQEIIERGLMPQERVTAIHLAADSSFRPLDLQTLEPAMQALNLRAKGYTLFVGTVEPRKNVERLIQSYERLPIEMRREWPLVIAGSQGWDSKSVHARMALAEAEGWLRYMAFIDQRWLPALYAGARLMAYPSLYEGFGLPIVEAMACGTPVLTSSTSCMPEVAAGAARLVDPLDVEAITHALAECLDDEGWQAEARAKGLARAARLSWDRCVDETIEVYKRLA